MKVLSLITIATSGKSTETDLYADVYAMSVHFVLVFLCNSRATASHYIERNWGINKTTLVIIM